MMKYKVLYQNGARLRFNGELTLVNVGGFVSPCILQGEKKANVLDPRAIIWCGGKVVYHPRIQTFIHQKAIQEWLDKHPEWPTSQLNLN